MNFSWQEMQNLHLGACTLREVPVQRQTTTRAACPPHGSCYDSVRLGRPQDGAQQFQVRGRGVDSVVGCSCSCCLPSAPCLADGAMRL